MKRRDPIDIPEAVMDHVRETVSGAAQIAVTSLLQTGAGTAFASLEDTETGKTIGVVVVAMDADNAKKLIEFVRSLPGSTEARVS